jgi:hypothetical protein
LLSQDLGTRLSAGLLHVQLHGLQLTVCDQSHQLIFFVLISDFFFRVFLLLMNFLFFNDFNFILEHEARCGLVAVLIFLCIFHELLELLVIDCKFHVLFVVWSRLSDTACFSQASFLGFSSHFGVELLLLLSLCVFSLLNNIIEILEDALRDEFHELLTMVLFQHCTECPDQRLNEEAFKPSLSESDCVGHSGITLSKCEEGDLLSAFEISCLLDV